VSKEGAWLERSDRSRSKVVTAAADALHIQLTTMPVAS